MRSVLCLVALLAASTASAQPLPVQADLVRMAGSDTVYFGPENYVLDGPARATLTAQARLFLANPAVTATIEGHSDQRDPRDHALAAGERRASVVRDFLVSLGVQADRLTVVSWGRERPGNPGSNPTAWALNRRVVVTLDKPILQPPLQPATLPPPIPQQY